MATKKTTAVTRTRPVLQTETLIPPDTSALDALIIAAPRPDGFQIVDEQTCLLAQKHMLTLKASIDKIKEVLDPPCSTAHKIHVAYTGLRGFFLFDLEFWQGQFSTKILTWTDQEKIRVARENERLERERRAQEKADADAIEKNRLAEIERVKGDMFWLEDDDVAQEVASNGFQVAGVLPPPVYIPAPTISTIPGFSLRNKPLNFVVENLEDLIIECAKRLQAEPKDTSLVKYLTVDGAEVKAALKECGESISAVIPGIRAVREQTTSSR